MNGELWPGPGTVVLGTTGAAVVGEATPPEVMQALGDGLAAGTEGTALLASLRRAAPDPQAPIGVVARTHTGWAARIGGGMQLRTDYVGHRSLHAGPAELAISHPTRISLVPATAAWFSGQGVRELPSGVVSASGVALDIEVVVGVPATGVEGVRCRACGAWMHIRAIKCVSCDSLLAPPRLREVQPPVPVVTLTLDDGRSLALIGNVVVGREPGQDPRVRAGVAAALTVPDTERSVSRAHASLHLDGWDVVLEDHHSANGTAVRPSSAADGVALAPGARIRVLPGTEITLGRRKLQLIA